MELCSILCGNLDGRGSCGKMDTYICIAESLQHSPETITTLLISCTPIQNNKFKLWGKRLQKNKIEKKFPTSLVWNISLTPGFPIPQDYLNLTYCLGWGLCFVFYYFVFSSFPFPTFLRFHWKNCNSQTMTLTQESFLSCFPSPPPHLVMLVKTGTVGPYKFLFVTQVNPWLLFHLNCWDLNKIKSNPNIHVYLTLNENYQKKKAFSLWAISNHSQTHDRTQFHDP